MDPEGGAYWGIRTTPEISQNYPASIQCLAIIGLPAKRHINAVTLAGLWWPLCLLGIVFIGILVFIPIASVRSVFNFMTKKCCQNFRPPMTKLSGSLYNCQVKDYVGHLMGRSNTVCSKFTTVSAAFHLLFGQSLKTFAY